MTFNNSLKRFWVRHVQRNHLFAIIRDFMQLLGLWPIDDYNFRWRVWIVLFFIIFVNLIPSINYLRVAILAKDARKIGLCVPEIINNAFIAFATLSFVTNRRLLSETICEFEVAWTESFDKRWNEVRSRAIKITNRISLVAISFIHFVGIFYCLIPNAIFLTKRFILGSKDEEFIAFQLSDLYGFDWSSSIAIIAAEILMIPFFIVTSLAFLTPNLFYVSFIHYCSTYFKFVQLEIQRLNIDMAEEANDDERNLQQKLKIIVKAHQKALKFAGMLNRSMSFFMFAMCSALTMSVCFTAVRFTITLNDHIVCTKLILSTTFMIIQMFICCYLGTELTEQAFNVAAEISDLPFYKIKTMSLRRNILMIMMRSNYQVRITTGNFFHVNLKSFLDTISIIYTYFFVLKTLMNDERMKATA